MPKILYRDINFRAETHAMIDTANEIIVEYREQGFILTLRQLYYQFVARALLPNTERSYKRLGSIVNDARMAGLIDWDAIEDRTRWLREEPHWESVASVISSCAAQFKVDRWANQKFRPEVWIEKDALIGVIEGVCIELDVPYFACRGYVSQSEQWRAGMRHRRWVDAGQQPIVFHLGDHDPSGIDMTRDNQSRLRTFCGGRWAEVHRLALNMSQVEEHRPPPNPTKLTDARAAGYVEEFGHSSWELDALEPRMIAQLVRDAVEELISPAEWQASRNEQEDGRDQLADIADDLR